MTDKVLKVFSVCSGVDGLGLPFINHKKFKMVGFSEVDKDCKAVLRYHYPEVKNYGDITKISENPKSIPNFDVLIGGTPCQNLSMAGNREGINGDKSRLFFDFVKILRSKRPRYFVWENVEGTLTSQDGWDFAIVQMALAESGYSFRYELLTATGFGVPQIRTRVFIVGCRKSEASRKVFCRELGSPENGQSGESKIQNPKDGSKVLAYSKSTRTLHLDHRMRVNDSLNTFNTGDGCSSQSSYNYVLMPNGGLRKLMPIECERAMGWPDNYTRYGINEKGAKYRISDSARYAMCGNGVVSTCVEPIRDFILDNEERLKRHESASISRKNTSRVKRKANSESVRAGQP